jgi:hypothetical protein
LHGECARQSDYPCADDDEVVRVRCHAAP